MHHFFILSDIAFSANNKAYFIRGISVAAMLKQDSYRLLYFCGQKFNYLPSHFLDYILTFQSFCLKRHFLLHDLCCLYLISKLSGKRL